jgi:predicted dehydrogenase
MNNIYAVGIIGLGAMGRRMLDGFHTHPRFAVHSVFDQHSVDVDVPLAPNVEAMLNELQLDAVYIATPPSSHAELVMQAIKADKAVLCEKPLTVSPGEADMLVRFAREHRAKIAVNFNYATAASAVQLLELVRSNALGDAMHAKLVIRLAQWPRGWQGGAVTWLAHPKQGGFVREIVSHFVFLAQRLFGPGVLESSVVKWGTAGTEERVQARIVFGGVPLELDAAIEGTLEDHNYFEVSGSLGTATITDWYTLESPFGTRLSERPDQGQIKAFAHLLDTGNSMLAGLEEAAEVVRIIEAILQQ